MKRVLVRGPLLSQSGYGEHARQLFRFCESVSEWHVSTQVLPWGITPWNINGDFESGLYGRIMQKSVPEQGNFDISFQVQLPHEWDPGLARCNVGVTAVVETNKCSREWATTHREKMDLVIVPSAHARVSMTTSGTGQEKTPIKIVPEAYYDGLLAEPTSDPLADIASDKNFLIVGTLTSDDPDADRKCLHTSIAWFFDAFKSRPDVGLIVKTTKGRDTTIDRELVRKMMRTIKKRNENSRARLYLLHGSMTRQEMTNLYKSSKLIGLISATRGEGFGLPLLEAAAVGLPIVATNWSAHTEFLEGPSFLKVAYTLVNIPASRVDGKIFVPEAKWAQPKDSNFKRKLKQLANNNGQLTESAQKLASKVRTKYSLAAVFGHYRKALEEIM